MLHQCYNIDKITGKPGNRKEKKMKLERAIEKAIDRCNLIGVNCDVYGVLYQYKAIRELSYNEVDAIYDKVVKVLGF